MKKLLFLLLPCLLLLACKKSDPCEGIECGNNGDCINGTCDCTEYYEGPGCNDLKEPDQINLNQIIFGQLPAVNGSENWDLFDGPDVYIVISNAAGDIAVQSNVVLNHDVSIAIDINTTGAAFQSINETFYIRVYDSDDLSAHDLMAEASFIVFPSFGNQPIEYLLIDGTNGSLFELFMKYQY